MATRNARADRRFGLSVAPIPVLLCVAVWLGLQDHDYWFAASTFVGAVLLGVFCISLITTKAPK